MNAPHFLDDGFEIAEAFISTAWHRTILEEIAQTEIAKEVNGVRHIHHKLPSVAAYLNSAEFKGKSKIFLPINAKLVRAILFNKSPESNWYVTWHQDKTVSVSEKFDDSAWRAWSVKDGTLHVQPPIAVLENMVTIRVHLDDTPKENGCLKVIPESHLHGILTSTSINEIVSNSEVHYCEAQEGAALIMRPHLLHASSKSTSLRNRRVLHFEFSDWRLPDGITWA